MFAWIVLGAGADVVVGAEAIVVVAWVVVAWAFGADACVMSTYATAATIIITTITIAAIIPLFILSHYGADGGELEPAVAAQFRVHGAFA